ncbi:ComF family protein [Oscillatoria sp. CS-180]|uniref:ComF family protein n=1 Tax=Oscillatoria sp. CS-180 TaxID=3021720 RepID=UPI00232B1AA0|nr:ComF family protein [Oscillatoria sp. CS-180]MDB9525133.1 ComF family protein [Oscillatoria sp. CS-180]
MLIRSLKGLSDLFLHQNCPLCDRSAPTELCTSCWRQIQQCAQAQPASTTPDALVLFAWGDYRDGLKQAIAALKYDNNPQLAMPLGKALGHHWQQFPIQLQRSPLVVPIPMHRAKQRKRGFNQAELLARAFCEQTGLPLHTTGLIRRVATVPQFSLGLQERQQNLAGAFALGPAFLRRPPQRPVLLLDDIYTTGTTVKIAAAELRRHRISVCGVAVIARTLFETEGKDR